MVHSFDILTSYLKHLSPLQGYFYLLCCFSRKFFSIGIAINFDIWLNIICSRFSLISFGRKFCYLFLDQFGFQDCSFDLICLFWVNSFYLLCCFSMKFFSIGIDIKFDIWLNIICSRCFIDIFW